MRASPALVLLCLVCVAAASCGNPGERDVAGLWSLDKREYRDTFLKEEGPFPQVVPDPDPDPDRDRLSDIDTATARTAIDDLLIDLRADGSFFLIGGGNLRQYFPLARGTWTLSDSAVDLLITQAWFPGEVKWTDKSSRITLARHGHTRLVIEEFSRPLHLTKN